MPPKSKTFVCDQHASNISKKLQTFYRDQLFFDIALVTKTDNIKVHAHRTVLSASSDYFLAMLCSTLKEARSDVIELGIDGATLKLVVDFMYSGTIELRCENVTRILTAADVLKMNTLKVACSDFIGETIDANNWLSIASMAKEHQSAELHKKALEFALQHFEEVCKKDEFLQLTEEQLSELISSDDLYVNSEETVFHSVVSWVKYGKGHRESSIIDLLSHVRFSFLTPDFIIDNRHSISKTYECLELLFGWLESQLSKRHSERKKANRTERETLGIVSGEWTDNLKLQTFDPESNIWSCEDLPAPPTKRANYRAMVVDKKLIIAGGMLVSGVATNIVECLNLQTKKWTNLPPMRQARQLPGMAEFNGNLYVVGGKSNGKWLCSAERYDFRTCEWQDLAPMHRNSGRSSVKVTVLGGLLYAVGDGISPTECFNPTKNQWIQLQHKNERSTFFGIAGVGGHVYAVGGSKDNGQKSTSVERFNPSTNTWTVINPCLELGLDCLLCVSWNNRLIACRGFHNQNEVYNSVLEYNPEENEWKTLAPLADYDLPYSSTSLFMSTFIN